MDILKFFFDKSDANQSKTHGRLVQLIVGGAEEIHGFVPTRRELELLAEHWLEVKLPLLFNAVLCDKATGDDIEVATSRLIRIEELLGEDAIRAQSDRINAD